MNKSRIAQYCCAALVAAGVGLNIQNAIADYGIGENSFSLVAGPGSNSGSNSNSNWNPNTDTLPDISDSDSNGDDGIKKDYIKNVENITCTFVVYDKTPDDQYSCCLNGNRYFFTIQRDGTGFFSAPCEVIDCDEGGNVSCKKKKCADYHPYDCRRESY